MSARCGTAVVSCPLPATESEARTGQLTAAGPLHEAAGGECTVCGTAVVSCPLPATESEARTGQLTAAGPLHEAAGGESTVWHRCSELSSSSYRE